MQENSDAPSWVTLTEGEILVWSGHPSLLSAGGSFLVGFILVVTGIGVGIFNDGLARLLALVFVGIGILMVGATYVNYRSTQYVLTSEEVYKKSGLISRNVTNIRLDRIQNTSYSQSLPERFMTFGSVHIDTAGTGGTDIVLTDVPNPERVNGLITEQLDNVRPNPPEQQEPSPEA
ncbi:PH domain-containing protein [Halocatena halophila]|uniref:PH domain-containing protein n=1 Tax=Halocatena halophila TaxID=2814576 RepID=UPI002ED51E65